MRNGYKILLAVGLMTTSADKALGQAGSLPTTFDAIAGFCEGKPEVEQCRSSQRFRLMRVLNERILKECLPLRIPIPEQNRCIMRLQNLFRYDATRR
ncbi:MAG: hypothetical protein K2Q32_07470 [Alphaproteobacteria bacterium]|nr:hypothetical protein [Alphaproteobacteria bacterium]